MPLGQQNLRDQEQPAVDEEDCWAIWRATVKSQKEERHSQAGN